MNLKLVLCLLIILQAKFGLTKWNNLSKCQFKNNNTSVIYECEDSDKYAERSDLSCCKLGCEYTSTKQNHSTIINTVKFLNCKVSMLGIGIFDKYQLVALDLSNMDLEILLPSDFHLATKLQKLNASHNRLFNISDGLFVNAPKLKQLDLSFNKIERVDSFGDRSTEMELIDLSHNRIRSIHNQTFANLAGLIELNLEHNSIETIDTNVFSINRNLKRIRLDGNTLKEFICSGYFVIYEVNLSHNNLKKFNGKCVVIRDSLEINVVKNENEDIPVISSGKKGSKEGTWMFEEADLCEMKSLNLSNSLVDGLHGMIGQLKEPLKVLDVTGNYLGVLSANTFDQLTNLEVLVLRNTSLNTIKFGLFHHQKNLHLLDISYNSLKKIQFKAFGRNLINLQTFYLDGNNLTEIDGLQKESFPKVTVLGISDNNFACEYLVNYLDQWHGVELIKDKSSNYSHVEKIACDKQLTDYFGQRSSTTTYIPQWKTSETLPLTVPTFTTSELIASESIPSDESTATKTTVTKATVPESTIPENTSITSSKYPVREKEDLHEKYLGYIFIVLTFISVIFSLICVMATVKYSISMWSNRRKEDIRLDVMSPRVERTDNVYSACI